MRRLALIVFAAVAAVGWLGWSSPVSAANRTAKEILADLDKAQIPEFNPKDEGNNEAITTYFIKVRDTLDTRSALLRELVEADPNNDQLPALLSQLWQNQMLFINPLTARKLTDEIDEVIAKARNPKLKTDATFFRTVVILRSSLRNPEAALPAIEAFIKVAPKDERGAQLLHSVAGQVSDPEKRKSMLKRILADYPESRAAKTVEGSFRRLAAVGKPFELEFTDAIKGTHVSMKDLRGKVVVVDFWATWCKSCVEGMPKMKRLYEEYRGQGVEFLGVSLDDPKAQGGLDMLKEFVAQYEVPWPQYYQGDGIESKFSGSWGIDSLPCVFVVDQEGKLYSVEADDKLEELIPELLKKGRSKAEGN